MGLYQVLSMGILENIAPVDDKVLPHGLHHISRNGETITKGVYHHGLMVGYFRRLTWTGIRDKTYLAKEYFIR